MSYLLILHMYLSGFSTLLYIQYGVLYPMPWTLESTSYSTFPNFLNIEKNGETLEYCNLVLRAFFGNARCYALFYVFGPETPQFFHYIANEAIYIVKQSLKKFRTYFYAFWRWHFWYRIIYQALGSPYLTSLATTLRKMSFWMR